MPGKQRCVFLTLWNSKPKVLLYMDISRKLSFYKREMGRQKEHSSLSPALIALRDHYSARLLFDDHPVLLREKSEPAADINSQIDLKIVSRGEFDRPVALERCLFFDLETSGLMGGSGVYAFLIGFAWWAEGRIHIRQYFLPDFGREPLLFLKLDPWFKSFDYLVSFNGKSFDLPVLNSRFLMNRLDLHLKKLKHIDLIHPVRRVWKDSLPSCDLQSLELHLLERRRDNDIPGAFIPQVYFDFLQTGRIQDIIRVIDHNDTDLGSLIFILDKLNRIFDDSRALALDIAARARVARIIAGQKPVPLQAFKILESSGQEPESAEYLYWKSMALKRAGKAEQAHTLWQKLQRYPVFTFRVMEESAKYLEHNLRKNGEALKIVEQALHLMEIQREFGYRPEKIYADFLRRKKRLLQKS